VIKASATSFSWAILRIEEESGIVSSPFWVIAFALTTEFET